MNLYGRTKGRGCGGKNAGALRSVKIESHPLGVVVVGFLLPLVYLHYPPLTPLWLVVSVEIKVNCNDGDPCSLALWHGSLVTVWIYAQAALHRKR